MPIEGWSNEEIGALGTVITGKTPSTKNDAFWQGDIPFITPPDLRGKRVRHAQRSITADGLAVVNAIPRHAVMVCCIGSIGLTGVCDVERAATNQQINSVIVDESRADAGFCHYAIVYNRPALLAAAQMTTVPILNKSNFSRIRLWVPPLGEQRQIAATLSAVQRAIERQERLISLTAELKNALMQKLFTEGTRGEAPRQTEIGAVPQSWRAEPLARHLVVAQYGLSVKSDHHGTTPILRMTNQVDGRIVASDLQMVRINDSDHSRFRVTRGDILFNRTNSFDLVGRTAIFQLEGDFVFASYLIRLRTQAKSLRSDFLNHYFNWGATQSRLKGIASRAVSQSNISASRLRGFCIPIPSPEEQEEIVRCLDQLDVARSMRERQASALQDLFRTLLHQLMTGQLRVHNLDLSALEEPEQEPLGAV
jgi:type I restriction enzyme S subunit